MCPGGWVPICQPSDGPLCVLITQLHVPGAFWLGCWNSIFQESGSNGSEFEKETGLIRCPEFSQYSQIQISMQWIFIYMYSYPLLAPPQTSPPTAAIANGHAYFCSMQSSALASARDCLERLPLNLMGWVLYSRQRTLMTAANLLTSTSPDCRSWHLKPRLDRRAHCLSDLHSLPP